MGALAELLATGDRQALEFFVLRLQEVDRGPVDVGRRTAILGNAVEQNETYYC